VFFVFNIAGEGEISKHVDAPEDSYVDL